jgi:hypothetical protein
MNVRMDGGLANVGWMEVCGMKEDPVTSKAGASVRISHLQSIFLCRVDWMRVGGLKNG